MPIARHLVLLCIAMSTAAYAAGERHVDHLGASTVVIGVSPSAIMPQVGRAKSDQALAWLSFTNRPVTVIFEASIADHMTCKSPTPFAIEGNKLVAKLGEGAFASFCHLGFGEYPYEVIVGGAEGRERRLRGTLVVE